MATATFDQLKNKLDAACESLRGFTLGHEGYTQKDGRNGIKLVEELIGKFSKLPDSTLGKRNPTTLIAIGRGRIKAAEARLALLKKKC
jgi:hypothetical protein